MADHSMARANLKKSEYFSTSTTTASKYFYEVRSEMCLSKSFVFMNTFY